MVHVLFIHHTSKTEVDTWHTDHPPQAGDTVCLSDDWYRVQERGWAAPGQCICTVTTVA